MDVDISDLLTEEERNELHLPAEAAMYLDAQVGSPCLRILRHYMGIKRNILEISESYHPGDRYALTMNMRANR